MDFTDSEIIPISAISHHLYCPRQCALIHVEGIFEENDLTASGRAGHERVDEEKSFVEHGIRKEMSLPVYSDTLGISGIADVVEFPANAPPFVIDYKHGKISSWEPAEAQVTAIVMCLEEMLGCAIPTAAIYHIQSHKRRDFDVDKSLRGIALQAIAEIRESFRNRFVPAAQYSKKLCGRCSLLAQCLPELNSIQTEQNNFRTESYG